MGNCLAQTAENFSDGNIANNPTWLGDDSLFKVNALLQLQSQNINGQIGDRYLFTQQNLLAEMEWQFWVRMAFNPSSQNLARWILAAHQNNFKADFDGYYVQLGGSTGSTDSISLYVQKNGVKTCLIKGRPATLGKINNLCNIKVIRNKLGQWQLFSDTSNTQTFALEGSCLDTTLTLGKYTGFVFKCTIGNVLNFYADDIYFGEPMVDFTAPRLTDIYVKDSLTLMAQFSEKVSSPLQVHVNNLAIINSTSIDGKLWELKLGGALPINVEFSVLFNQVLDLNKNALDTLVYLLHHPLEIGDLWITELLPDPDPSVGLPNAEFMEIYNNSAYPISLEGMILADPSTQTQLPKYVLQANSYVIVCAAKDTQVFQSHGAVLGLNPWPSLNNTSDVISFMDTKKNLVQTIDYTLDWYQNKLKENGGYSLEMIHPKQTCKGQKNWQASMSQIGGTPGKVNAVWKNNTDSLPPSCIAVNILNEQTLLLQYNEAAILEENMLVDMQKQWPQIASIKRDLSNGNQIRLELNQALQHQKSYEIDFGPVRDCMGNKGSQLLKFSYFQTKAAQQNDVLINEIYYDENRIGQFPNQEYIELYNRSDFAINLSKMKLSDAVSTVWLSQYLLLPKSYLIVCHQSHTDQFLLHGSTLGLSSFPSLSLGDKITLRDSMDFVIHQVVYEDAWIKKAAPVYACSIELIDPQNPCGGSANWQASQSTAGATPGKVNSVYGSNPDKNLPQLFRVYAPNKHVLQLSFNKELDSLSLRDSFNFCLNQTHCAKDYSIMPEDRKRVLLSFQEPLNSLLDYTLSIKQARDCAGNLAQNSLSDVFQLPKNASRGEVVINEILFNPKPNGYDFIELYNTTDHSIELSNLHLINIGSDRERNMDILFAETGIQIQGHEYLAVSENPEETNVGNGIFNKAKWVKHTIPSMGDDGGEMVLVNAENVGIDSVVFNKDYHLNFIYDEEGVSLEKINPILPGYLANNWSSASENFAYATPTLKNSQYRISQSAGAFGMAEPYFSPDGDGLNDVMTFTYETQAEKCVGDLIIYNLQGQVIKEVCRSAILMQKGEFNWFGDTENGSKAGIGNYLALWKVYDAAGEKESKKVSFSLLAK